MFVYKTNVYMHKHYSVSISICLTQIAPENTITLMGKCIAFVRYISTVDHRPCNGKHFAARAKSWDRLPLVIITKVYIATGIPTRVVGTCFCGENLGSIQKPIYLLQFQSLLICNDI